MTDHVACLKIFLISMVAFALQWIVDYNAVDCGAFYDSSSCLSTEILNHSGCIG